MKNLLTFCLLLLFINPLWAESRNEKIGREMHEKILQDTPIYADKKVSDYVNKVGQSVVKASGVKEPRFTFTVIDDQTINAFALPGGYIYVHRGLLTYLNSEAQLAAVLAHEVGHITENHHGRQKRAAAGNAIVAGVLGVLSGSADVAEASGLWGQTLVSGFGRDMELEADKVGAEYMIAAGYDPQAIIDVISLLKDHERLEKKRALESGKKVQTYHGLFATHPRNDRRLREAVNQAGQLGSTSGITNVDDFRLATEGLVWGRNYAEASVPANVFQHDQLAFRFNIPTGWAFTENKTTIVGKPQAAEGEKTPPETKDARLELTIMPRTTEAPVDYIKNRLNIKVLKKSEPINPNRLAGQTGIIRAEDDQPEKRLAVIYYGRYAYVFKGDLIGKGAKEQDKLYLQVIASFRPISKRSLQAREAKTIHYVKATPATTFAALSNYLKLGKFGEDELRIINNYYPTGQPKPGEWIKIIN